MSSNLDRKVKLSCPGRWRLWARVVPVTALLVNAVAWISLGCDESCPDAVGAQVEFVLKLLNYVFGIAIVVTWVILDFLNASGHGSEGASSSR